MEVTFIVSAELWRGLHLFDSGGYANSHLHFPYDVLLSEHSKKFISLHGNFCVLCWRNFGNGIKKTL